MAEEKEASFPINGFAGINRNVDREELGQEQFYQLQNLWERKLGTLETRNGSDWVMSAFPGGVTTLDNITKIYKVAGENPRVLAVNTTGSTSSSGTLPAAITLSFVTDANGWWNKVRTFGATDYGFTHEYVILRLVGYGTDKIYRVAVTAITGYSAATNQKLRVQVTSALASGVTGIEVLAVIHNGTTIVPGAVAVGSAYNYRTMWVGFINMNGLTTSDTSFLYSPYGYQTGRATPSSSGTLKMAFTCTAVNSGSGTLVAGKTYYVLVLPQFTQFSTDPRASYRSPAINTDTEIVAVTIPYGTNSTGVIAISGMSPLAVNFLVAVGEHPNLLQPYKIFNDSTTTNAAVNITEMPVGNPGVINIDRTITGSSAVKADCSFNFSNFSKHDMLMKVDSAGVTTPVFCGNVFPALGGTWDTWYDQFGWTTPDTGAGRQYVDNLINATATMESMGWVGRYQYAPWRNLALFVNSGGFSPTENNQIADYFVTDGNIASPVVMDFQSTTASARVTLPNAKYIGIFESSVVLGGGIPGIDPNNGGSISSARQFYISRAGNFSDFTIAGAAAPVLNYLRCDSGEDINGFGAYTNSTSQLGPQAQPVISNKNGLWILTDLPTFGTTGTIDNLSSVKLRMLSKKVGAAHQNTFAYTPIGTIVTSNLGVFVLRESGEPTPVGQSMIGLLREADLSAAFACYHDQHYKISFYHPDYDTSGTPDATRRLFPTINNCEFWLNINKLVEKKGQEDWVGPMLGRGVQTCVVEDRDKDGLTYSIARDRYTLGQNGAGSLGIYKADVEPTVTATVINDFSTPVTVIMETGELKSAQDNNWNKLIKRWYWKLRTNLLVGAPMSYTDKTYIDGVLVETQSLTTYTSISNSFKNLPFILVRVFPTSRLRGRMMRKYFSTSSRVAINGFQINYEIERRRI